MQMVRESEFERLVAEHAQGLFGFLTYRTGDRALAEDLLADTLEAAYRHRARFDRRRASERTWLYTIALNRLRDHARRRAAESRALERVAGARPDGPRSGPESVEDRDLAMRALGVLSEPERECVALRFGGDLTLEEIARAIGERRTTVEGRLYGALRKMRADIGAP